MLNRVRRHGGPGGGCSADDRRHFDPAVFRIVLFDQRGAGRSTPHACLEDNNTWALVEDIEKIRVHLRIEKWAVFGGSWGTPPAALASQDAVGLAGKARGASSRSVAGRTCLLRAHPPHACVRRRIHAVADVRADAHRSCGRADSAGHLHAAPQGAAVVLPGEALLTRRTRCGACLVRLEVSWGRRSADSVAPNAAPSCRKGRRSFSRTPGMSTWPPFRPASTPI